MAAKIAYELNADDLDVYDRYFIETSLYVHQAMRRAQRRSSVLILMLFAMGVFIFAADEEGREVSRIFAYVSVAYGLLYGAYVWFLFPKRFRIATLRRSREAAKIHARTSRLGYREIAIVGDRVASKGVDWSSEHAVAKLQDPIVHEGYCYIFIDGMTAIVIPSHKVAATDLDNFLSEFRAAKGVSTGH